MVSSRIKKQYLQTFVFVTERERGKRKGKGGYGTPRGGGCSQCGFWVLRRWAVYPQATE